MDKKKKENPNLVVPTILKVRDLEDKSKYKQLHPNLPVPPFCMLCCGSVRSGKSNFIVSALRGEPEQNGFFGTDYFDKVVIMSNTINNDPKGKFLMDAFEVIDHYDDKYIKEYIEEQKEFPREDMPTGLIVLDDIISRDFKRTSEISFLSSRYRHIETSIILAVQSFRAVSNVIRNNSDFICIFKQNNFKELSKIAEEYSDYCGSEELFMRYYNYCMKEKYNIMVINAQQNPAIFMKNFDTIMGYGDKPTITLDQLDSEDEDVINYEEQDTKASED